MSWPKAKYSLVSEAAVSRNFVGRSGLPCQGIMENYHEEIRFSDRHCSRGFYTSVG